MRSARDHHFCDGQPSVLSSLRKAFSGRPPSIRGTYGPFLQQVRSHSKHSSPDDVPNEPWPQQPIFPVSLPTLDHDDADRHAVCRRYVRWQV